MIGIQQKPIKSTSKIKKSECHVCSFIINVSVNLHNITK